MDTAPETMWPSLPVDEWSDTRDTLQLFTQVVGKVRLSHSPLMSHWWNVPLYVNRARVDHVADVDHRRTGLRDRFRLRRAPAADRRGRHRPHRRTPTTNGVEFLLRGDGRTRRTRCRPGRLADARRDTWRHPLRGRPSSSFVRQGIRGAVLAGVDQHFAHAPSVPWHLCRKGKPGAPLLGRTRLGRHPVLGTDRASPLGRCAALRRARDVGGLLARGEQRGVLARRGERRGVLQLRLPRARRLPRSHGRAGRSRVRRRARRISTAL